MTPGDFEFWSVAGFAAVVGIGVGFGLGSFWLGLAAFCFSMLMAR